MKFELIADASTVPPAVIDIARAFLAVCKRGWDLTGDIEELFEAGPEGNEAKIEELGTQLVGFELTMAGHAAMASHYGFGFDIQNDSMDGETGTITLTVIPKDDTETRKLH